MRVRYFATCLGDRLFPDAALDGVRLLRALGVEVEVALDASCCGQPAWNAGHREPARRMAEVASGILCEPTGVDGPGGPAAPLPVVLPSGSCAAMLRHTLPRMDVPAVPASELAAFLVRELGVTGVGRGLEGLRVAYHHGCHALRESGVREEPLTLLRSAGAEVVPWEADEECCGFGGLFSVKLPWVSGAMADRKLDTLPEVDVLTSADGGCLLQLGGRLGRRRSTDPAGTGEPPEVVHLASLLWRAHRHGSAAEPVDAGGGPSRGAT